MQSPKRYLFTVLIASLLLFLSSCEKDVEENHFNLISEYAKSNPALIPDSATKQRIWDAFANEREQVAQRMELLNPTLYKSYQADVKAFDTITSFESFKLTRLPFMDKYAEFIRTAIQESGISRKSLTEKVRNILGNIPFTLGEFGELTSGSRLLNGSSITTTSTTVEFSQIPLPLTRYTQRGSGIVYINSGVHKLYGCDARGNLVTSGYSSFEAGLSSQLNQTFNHIRIDFSAAKLQIHAYGCFGDVGNVQSTIDVILKPKTNASGRQIVRNLAMAWCMGTIVSIPVIDEKDEINPNMTIVANRADLNNEFEVLWKCASTADLSFFGTHSDIFLWNPDPIKISWFN